MRTTLVVVVLSCGLVTGVNAAELPSATVPDGIGLQIFIGGVSEGQFDVIQAAGINVVRVPLDWGTVEQTAGNYSWGCYDYLMYLASTRGMRVLYTLNIEGPNPYPTQPDSPVWREHFRDFAAASVAHFKAAGQGIPMYELWNEPNVGPFSGPEQYMELVNVTVPAMRAADPDCTIMGPTVVGITQPGGLGYLASCFGYGQTHPGQQGLLDLVDAVSVHPYGANMPEDIVSVYSAIRGMIDAIKPGVPIVSSEWGWNMADPGVTAERQAEYLSRMFLVNLSQGIPLSDWFMYTDQVPNYMMGITDVSGAPKPNYYALQQLTSALEGKSYSRRLDSDPQDWLLVFESPDGRETLAVWTTGSAHTLDVSGWGRLSLGSMPVYVVQPVPWFSNGASVAGSITIDGSMSDWTAAMKVGTDTYWDLTWDNDRNLNDFYMVNDATTLCGRFTVYGNAPTGLGSMLDAITFCFDMDNNAATGGTVTFEAASMPGVDVMVTMTMGAHDGLWPNNVDKWNGSSFAYYGPTNSASDGTTGSEWALNLAAFGNDGATPVRWIAVQRWRGDIFGGDTWGGPAVPQTYTVVTHSPDTALLGTVDVQGYRGDKSLVSLTFQLTPTTGGQAATRRVFLDSSGAFRLDDLTEGTYTIAVKNNASFRTVLNDVPIYLNPTILTAPIVLTGADCNGDNLVTFEDFAMLQNAFGQTGVDGASPRSAAAAGGCGLLGALLLGLMALCTHVYTSKP